MHYVPGFGTGDAKIDTTWPLPSSKFALFVLYKCLRKLRRHKHVHFTDGEAKARWGHTPGSAEVLDGTPTFFFQIQCPAYSFIDWHDWDETQRGFGWPKGNHSRCLRTLKLVLTHYEHPNAFHFYFSSRCLAPCRRSCVQSGLSDTLQEWLKCSLKNSSLLIVFWNDPMWGKGLGLFEAASLRTLATGVVKCSQKYCLAWKPLSMQMSHW